MQAEEWISVWVEIRNYRLESKRNFHLAGLDLINLFKWMKLILISFLNIVYRACGLTKVEWRDVRFPWNMTASVSAACLPSSLTLSPQTYFSPIGWK